VLCAARADGITDMRAITAKPRICASTEVNGICAMSTTAATARPECKLPAKVAMRASWSI
jgi:hypothetical protein